MTQPINPHTTLPMSLQVDKMQQIKQLHSEQQQGLLAQKKVVEDNLNRQKVNANTETEEGKVRDNNQGKSKQEQNGHRQEQQNQNDDKEKDNMAQKGFYIDIKI